MNNFKKFKSGAGQAMEPNDEANKARMEKIFGNHLILNNILEQLPNSNLLELSLVNKFWKEQARSVMKKRDDVTALLKCDGARGCGQVFKDFAADLETFNEVTYSGMTIRIPSKSGFHCKGTGALELEAIHESIVNGMKGKLTRLSIELVGWESCWKWSDCTDFSLLRLLLRDFIGDLEHLTLNVDSTAGFIDKYLPLGPYPKLKVMKLHDISDDKITFGNQIKMLLRRAPNLRAIHTKRRMILTENLMEGREGVVHVHEAGVGNPVKDISDDVIPALRLKSIWLYYTPEPELTLDGWNEKAQSLLRTCCATTLKYLRLDASSAVRFMSYGIRLLNVKDLSIDLLSYDLFQSLDPQKKSIMTRFDFTYFLPKLESVTIGDYRLFSELSPSEMTAISERVNKAVRREPTLPRACNIKTLDVELSYITVDAVEFFSKVFPAIQRLTYLYTREYKCKAFPFESAWDHWPDLKFVTERYCYGRDEKLYQRPCP